MISFDEALGRLLGAAQPLGPERVPPALTVVACAASVLPDIDALGFAAGVPYGHVFGHRGFTHSLFFALMTAVLCSLFAKQLGQIVENACHHRVIWSQYHFVNLE